ncbi:integrase core domain-containing protein [Streptomyces sp. 2R]
MESTIGLFKTEVIKPQRTWKTLSHVEFATAEWVDRYNHRRLHAEIGTSRPSNTRPTTTEQPRNPSSQPPTEISTEPGGGSVSAHLVAVVAQQSAGSWSSWPVVLVVCDLQDLPPRFDIGSAP